MSYVVLMNREFNSKALVYSVHIWRNLDMSGEWVVSFQDADEFWVNGRFGEDWEIVYESAPVFDLQQILKLFSRFDEMPNSCDIVDLGILIDFHSKLAQNLKE
jgi:hypothetical protein